MFVDVPNGPCSCFYRRPHQAYFSLNNHWSYQIHCKWKKFCLQDSCTILKWSNRAQSNFNRFDWFRSWLVKRTQTNSPKQQAKALFSGTQLIELLKFDWVRWFEGQKFDILFKASTTLQGKVPKLNLKSDIIQVEGPQTLIFCQISNHDTARFPLLRVNLGKNSCYWVCVQILCIFCLER